MKKLNSVFLLLLVSCADKDPHKLLPENPNILLSREEFVATSSLILGRSLANKDFSTYPLRGSYLDWNNPIPQLVNGISSITLPGNSPLIGTSYEAIARAALSLRSDSVDPESLQVLVTLLQNLFPKLAGQEPKAALVAAAIVMATPAYVTQ